MRSQANKGIFTKRYLAADGGEYLHLRDVAELNQSGFTHRALAPLDHSFPGSVFVFVSHCSSLYPGHKSAFRPEPEINPGSGLSEI